ncbi:Protein of unknown function [Actinoplanes derwentensis]|uniref:DUF3311 domain-containing protein n=1 Tax=Actinoplanes derwentensis TaxID=113562 RepID=A0A1H1XLK3_9ACTN|nr:DUF3311 domain-containing protein [Actinoplanes derwentensis]SDT09596.1 Protein of unknown function [Actinoplanes derwentensis]
MTTPPDDRSRWHWLLITIVVPLTTVLYNTAGPELGGFPLFCWLQLASVGLVVAITALVYRLTRRGR